MQLSKDLREFVALLNSNRVEYLVVGGFAVAWHGQRRFTANIDFLIRATAACDDIARRQRGFPPSVEPMRDALSPNSTVALVTVSSSGDGDYSETRRNPGIFSKCRWFRVAIA